MYNLKVENSSEHALDTKIWAVLLVIILAFGAVFLYAREQNIKRGEGVNEEELSAKYTNYPYGVSLRFPAGWLSADQYDYDRYEGRNGFFGIMAGGSENTSIDEIVNLEVEHRLRPYGTTPEIKDLKIDNQEARLVLPSDDQNDSMNSQAVLIVKYPNPMIIDDETYTHLIFIADSAHIEVIADSITFLR